MEMLNELLKALSILQDAKCKVNSFPQYKYYKAMAMYRKGMRIVDGYDLYGVYRWILVDKNRKTLQEGEQYPYEESALFIVQQREQAQLSLREVIEKVYKMPLNAEREKCTQLIQLMCPTSEVSL